MATLGTPTDPSFLARLGQGLGNNQMALLGLAGGLLGGQGFSGGFDRMALGSKIDQSRQYLARELAEKKKKEEAQQRSFEALKRVIGEERAAAMGPERASEYFQQLELYKNKPKPPEDRFSDLMLGPDGKTFIQRNLTTNEAKALGGGGVNVYTGDELPKPAPGYQWDPDKKSQSYIKGGPEDPAVKAAQPRNNQPIPAEVAGRLGLAKVFYEDYPGIIKAIDEGRVTADAGVVQGPMNAAKLAIGTGTPDKIYRQIEGGKEALVRMLTGAGMPLGEAQAQADQYSLLPTDSAERVKDKISNLKRRLEAGESLIREGRGALQAGQQPAQPTTAPADPLGIR